MNSTATKHEVREHDVVQLLLDIGVRTNTQGYYLMRDAIQMVCEDEKVMRSVCKELYGGLAHAHDTTSTAVERNIRHSIHMTWKKGDRDQLKRIFAPRTIREGPPTVSHWITRLAQEVRLRVRK